MRRYAVVLLCVVLLLADLQPAPPAQAQDAPPAVGEALATWPLRSPKVFDAWTCPDGRNSIAFADEGLTMRVTGRCRDTSVTASIDVTGKGIVVADGEIAVDVRVPVGRERARLFFDVRVQPDNIRGYYVFWDPGRGIAELRKMADAGTSVLLAARDDVPVVQPEHWSRFALVLEGPRMWVTLDGQVILAASDDAFDAGAIGVRTLRLGSLESDAEVVSTWRDLRIAPLAEGSLARAPQLAPSLLPPARIMRPAPTETVVREDMRTASLFWPEICPTGKNVGSYELDGLRLAIAGPCYATSTAAQIQAEQPDVTVGDGEARFEVRVERGWDLALVSLTLLSPDSEAASLTARIAPGAQTVGLMAESTEGVRPLAMRHFDETVMRPDGWISLALERVGDRAWLVLNDEPVLAIDAVPTATGSAIVYVSRMGPAEGSTEVVVTLRDFTASAVEGGDPGRSVARAPRPVVDPRYERILTFIHADLVDDPGLDAQAAERRAIGRAILDMIEETRVNLEVAPLPELTAARFYPYRRVIYVDERLMTYTPHVATMLLLHEIVHAHQEQVGLPRTCLEREIDTATWESRLWRAWFGPDGKQPPGDSIEADFSAVVQFEREGRLRENIEQIYREKCSGL